MPANWFDAIAWCNALSEMEGLQPCYRVNGRILRTSAEVAEKYADIEWVRAANGYRLPTIREWQWAFSGGTASKGFQFSGSNNIDEVAVHPGNSKGTKPVGSMKPNELGIFDMSGNAWEWAWDLIANKNRPHLGGAAIIDNPVYFAANSTPQSEPHVAFGGIRPVRNAPK